MRLSSSVRKHGGRLRSFAATLLLALAACAPTPAPVTSAAATKAPPAAATLLPTTSAVEVPDAELKGLTIQVWHPWFGTDASLFETMVEEFNNKNLWGFQVASIESPP